MTQSITIGILSIQGDIEENASAIRESMEELGIDGNIMFLREINNIDLIDGLIIPEEKGPLWARCYF